MVAITGRRGGGASAHSPHHRHGHHVDLGFGDPAGFHLHPQVQARYH